MTTLASCSMFMVALRLIPVARKHSMLSGGWPPGCSLLALNLPLRVVS
jgi:hypothetical protein